MTKRTVRLNTVFLFSAAMLLVGGVVLRLTLCDAIILEELTQLVLPLVLAAGAALVLRKLHGLGFLVRHPWISSATLYAASLLVFLLGKGMLESYETVPAFGAVIAVTAAVPVLYAQREQDIAGFAFTTASLVPAIVMSWAFHSTIGVGISAITAVIILCVTLAIDWFSIEKSALNVAAMISCFVILLFLLVMPSLRTIHSGWLESWLHPYDDPLDKGFYAVSSHQIAKEASFFSGADSVHRWNDIAVPMDEIFPQAGDRFLLVSALNAYGWWVVALWLADVLLFLGSGFILCTSQKGVCFYLSLTMLALLAAQFVLYLLHQFGLSPIFVHAIPFFSADGIALFFAALPLGLTATMGGKGSSLYQPAELRDLLKSKKTAEKTQG